jgi:hypothetical protein
VTDSTQSIARDGKGSVDVQYVEYARDCERLARLASDPMIREQLFQMAREWMAAAMHEPPPPPLAPKQRF